MNTQITRRDFIIATAAVGGGMALGFAPLGATAQASTELAELNPWIVIQPDDSIVLRYARSEMGQGSSTATPMLIAEELHCDWNKVQPERVSTQRVLADPREYLTPYQDRWESSKASASRNVRDYHLLCRQAGASARERLIAAAANGWGVEPSECRAENSKIIHEASGRQTSYGAIAEAAAAIQLDHEPDLKHYKDWWLLGTPVKQLESPKRVDGSLVFGVDVRLPDMVYANAVTCPVFGGKLASYDFNAVADRPGVIAAVEVEGGVAVVADTFWRAKTALDLMPVSWDLGPFAEISSEDLRAERRAALDQAGTPAIEEGDARTVLASAATVVEADYEFPFVDHAALEPMACTARVEGDQLEIWVGTQCDLYTADAAAEAAGVPRQNVTMHVMHLGSAYGRRETHVGLEWVTQAVQAAKAVEGRPVKLIWTREQDMSHGLYRPDGSNRLRAALDESGNLIALHAHLIRGSWQIQQGNLPGPIDERALAGPNWWPYNPPANHLVEWTLQNRDVPLGAWRGVWYGQNSFVRESFIDELAHSAGKDPYEMRRALLQGKSDWLAVLDKVAEESGWGEPLPKGTGRGIAIYTQSNSIFAQVAEVSVSRRGSLRVERIVAGIDCRHAVNTLGIESQVETGLMHALATALYAQITIDKGRVVEKNFDTYRILTMAEAPQIDTHIVLSRTEEWGGVGELPHPTTAPAVCNAIFAATGKRLRSLPIMNHDLSWT